MLWLVTSVGSVEVDPYEDVVPYETVESAAMLVAQVMVALFVAMLAALTLEMTGADSLAQVVPPRVTVYTVEPVLWESIAVSVPALQVSDVNPPMLLVATVRS